jgi:phage shock protein C
VDRKLTRDTSNAILGGVAAGMGRYFGLDPVLIRVAFVIFTLAHGIGVLFYVICWLMIPPDPQSARPAPADRAAADVGAAGESVVERLQAAPGRGRLAFGVFLIGLGAVMLLDKIPGFDWPRWMTLGNLWPLVLVALGVAMIARSRGAEAN